MRNSVLFALHNYLKNNVLGSLFSGSNSTNDSAVSFSVCDAAIHHQYHRQVYYLCLNLRQVTCGNYHPFRGITNWNMYSINQPSGIISTCFFSTIGYVITKCCVNTHTIYNCTVTSSLSGTIISPQIQVLILWRLKF